jgi:hypothetical protein
MDPASIIGVTAAVLDFLDHGVKVVSVAKNIYDSASGKSVDLERMEQLCREMRELAQRLSSSSDEDPGTPAQKSLSSLAKQCLVTTDDIIELLVKCTAKSTRSLGPSLVAAVKSIIKKDKIDLWQRRLASTQVSLNTALLAVMRLVQIGGSIYEWDLT